jgi:hypothetical protein
MPAEQKRPQLRGASWGRCVSTGPVLVIRQPWPMYSADIRSCRARVPRPLRFHPAYWRDGGFAAGPLLLPGKPLTLEASCD